MPDRQRLFRGLRIAWSVGWGILCLLLVVLWMRSYWRIDILEMQSTRRLCKVSSGDGSVAIGVEHQLRNPSLGLQLYSPQVICGFEMDGVPTVPSQQWYVGLLDFDWTSNEDGRYLVIPYWFLALLSGTFAALPWLPWRF